MRGFSTAASESEAPRSARGASDWGTKEGPQMKMQNEYVHGEWSERERILTECIRFRPLLRQIAERLLNQEDDAEKAVNRCIVRATKAHLDSQSLGEFRAWILRLAIDESLLLLAERRAAAEAHRKGNQSIDSLGERIPVALLFARWMLVGVAD